MKIGFNVIGWKYEGKFGFLNIYSDGYRCGELGDIYAWNHEDWEYDTGKKSKS